MDRFAELSHLSISERQARIERMSPAEQAAYMAYLMLKMRDGKERLQ